MFVMWAYALIGRRLVEGSIDGRYARTVLFRTAIGPCFFFASIPASFFSTTLAVVIWLLASPLAFWVVRHKRQ